jgi:hypothetical protein
LGPISITLSKETTINYCQESTATPLFGVPFLIALKALKKKCRVLCYELLGHSMATLILLTPHSGGLIMTLTKTAMNRQKLTQFYKAQLTKQICLKTFWIAEK